MADNEKKIKTRIINKHDIENNWLKAINFIPKSGELIIYDPDDTYEYPRVKIGDGINNVNTLPFINNVGQLTENNGEIFNDYKNNRADGNYSHSEGYNTIAKGYASHAEGDYTQALGNYSHAEGLFAKAHGEAQHVQGKYNIVDNDNIYAHIVGNGTDDNSRSNAHTLDWNGNAWFAGNVIVGTQKISLFDMYNRLLTLESRFQGFNIYDGGSIDSEIIISHIYDGGSLN